MIILWNSVCVGRKEPVSANQRLVSVRK